MNRHPSDPNNSSGRHNMHVPQNSNGAREINPARPQQNLQQLQQPQRPPPLVRGAHFHPPPLNLVPPQPQMQQQQHFPQMGRMPQSASPAVPASSSMQPQYVAQAPREQAGSSQGSRTSAQFRGHRQHQHASRAYGQPYVHPSSMQQRQRHMQQQYHQHHRPSPPQQESPQYVQEHLRLQAQHQHQTPPPLLRPPVLQVSSNQQSLQQSQQQQQQQRYNYATDAPQRVPEVRQQHFFSQRQQSQPHTNYHQHQLQQQQLQQHQRHHTLALPQPRQQTQPAPSNTRYLEQLLASRPLSHTSHHFGRNVTPTPAQARPALLPNFPAAPTQAIVQPRYPRELVGFNYVTDENGNEIKVIERNVNEARNGGNPRQSNPVAAAVRETKPQQGAREPSPDIEILEAGPAPKLNFKTGKMEGGAGICKEIKDKSKERFTENQKRMNAIIDGAPLGYRPTVVSIERHQALRRQVQLLTAELRRQMLENKQVRQQCRDKLTNFKESSSNFHKSYDDLSKKSHVTNETYNEMVEKYYQEMKAKMKAEQLKSSFFNDRDRDEPCTSRQALLRDQSRIQNQSNNMNLEEIQVQIKQEPLTPPPGNSGRNSEVPSLDEEANIAQALAEEREANHAHDESNGLMVVYHSQTPAEEFEQFDDSAAEARAFAEAANNVELDHQHHHHQPDINNIEANVCLDIIPMEYQQQEQYYVPEEPYAYHPDPDEAALPMEEPNLPHDHHMIPPVEQMNPPQFVEEDMDPHFARERHMHPAPAENPFEGDGGAGGGGEHYQNYHGAQQHHQQHEQHHYQQQQQQHQLPLLSPPSQNLRVQLQLQDQQMQLQGRDQNQQGYDDGSYQVMPPAEGGYHQHRHQQQHQHQPAPNMTRRRRSAPMSPPTIPHHHQHHLHMPQRPQPLEYMHPPEVMPPPRAPPPLQYHGQRVPTPIPPRMHPRALPENTSCARSHQPTQHWVPNPEQLLRNHPDLFKQYEMYHRMRASGLNPPVPEDLQNFFHGASRRRRSAESRESRSRRRQMVEEEERYRQSSQRRTQPTRRQQMTPQEPIQPNIEIPDGFPPHTHLRQSHNVLLCGGGVVELKAEPDPIIPSVSNAVNQGWLENANVDNRNENENIQGRNEQVTDNVQGNLARGENEPMVEQIQVNVEPEPAVLHGEPDAPPYVHHEEVFADVEMMIKQHQDEQEMMAEQMLEVNYEEERGEPRAGCSQHHGNGGRNAIPPFANNPGTSKLELLLQAAERALENHQMACDEQEDDPDALVIDESVVINDVGIHGSYEDEEVDVKPGDVNGQVDDANMDEGANGGNSVVLMNAEEPEEGAEARPGDIVDGIIGNEGIERRRRK